MVRTVPAAWVVAGVVTVATALACGACTPSANTQSSAASAHAPNVGSRESGQPLLIHYAQYPPSTAAIAAHANWFRSLPFDGLVIGGRRLDPTAFFDPTTSYSEQQISAEVARLPRDMGTVRHNVFCVRLTRPFDWSDDAQWNTIASNMRNLARALHDSGKPWKGVFIDNEWYGNSPSPWDYGTTTKPWTYSATQGATPGLAPAEARALVRARGRQVMDSMIHAWPGIVVFNTQGPWVSEPATSAALQAGGVQENNVAFANELSASFTIGMMEASWGTAAQVVDGGRFYGLNTVEQFQTVRSWIRSGLAGHGTAGLPPGDTTAYENHVSASFGVYDRDAGLPGWPPVSPDALARRTRLALQECDRYVWLYTEAYDWGAPQAADAVPPAYLTAVSAARVAAQLVRRFTGP